MTPNPHRGSDFAEFLAEQGLMTPTMTPTNNLCSQLREYNAWRRGSETLDQPNPADIGVMIDAAADRLEELERELAAERALADRLAVIVNDCRPFCEPMRQRLIDTALVAWKEARRV
jgi:hypothetical protein